MASNSRIKVSVDQTTANTEGTVDSAKFRTNQKGEIDLQAVAWFDPSTGTFLSKSALQTALTFKHQDLVNVSNAAAVQNTWYTVLDTTLNAKVYMIRFSVSVANEDLEVRLTIDGVTYVSSKAAAVATTPYWVMFDGGLTPSNGVTSLNLGIYEALECRSIKVEIRKTSNNGAGTLNTRIIYGVRN